MTLTDSKKPETIDVVVVGAGLSGLRAAVKIHEAGYSVIVLEAGDRVGGKTLSVNASRLGGKVDLGAAWINDTNQSEMYKLAQEFGFDLIKQRATGLNLHQQLDGKVDKIPHGDGMPLPSGATELVQEFIEKLNRWVEEIDPENPSDHPEAKMLDSLTFGQLGAKHLGPELGPAVADSATSPLLGVGPDEVSALFMIDYFRSGTGVANMASDGKDGGQYLRNRQGMKVGYTSGRQLTNNRKPDVLDSSSSQASKGGCKTPQSCQDHYTRLGRCHRRNSQPRAEVPS